MNIFIADDTSREVEAVFVEIREKLEAIGAKKIFCVFEKLNPDSSDDIIFATGLVEKGLNFKKIERMTERGLHILRNNNMKGEAE